MAQMTAAMIAATVTSGVISSPTTWLGRPGCIIARKKAMA